MSSESNIQIPIRYEIGETDNGYIIRIQGRDVYCYDNLKDILNFIALDLEDNTLSDYLDKKD